MTTGIKTIIYPVTDLARAKALFSALAGAEPEMDQPYYVGYKINGQDVGLDPNGHRAGVTAYWHVEDVEASLRALVDAGATVHQEPKDVGGGTLIASVTDPDGNLIGLRQAG